MKPQVRTLIVFVVLATQSAWAFKDSQTLTSISVESALKVAKTRKILLQGMDTKDEIQKYTPTKFFTELKDTVSHDAQYQSFLYEVRDGRKEVEKAKLVAANMLYDAILTHWSELEKTVFNDQGIKRTEDRHAFIVNRLKELVYMPAAKQLPGEMKYFFASNWGNVKLIYDKKLKKFTSGIWKIDVNSQQDNQKLAPEAEKLEIIDESKAPTFN